MVDSVTPMYFEAVLNLVWALMGLAALGALGVSELRRGRATLRSRVRRGVAVLIATVALFPCISASDDLVCLEQLRLGGAAHAQLDGAQSRASNHPLAGSLALRLESLENFRISTSAFTLVTLAQCARVVTHTMRGFDRPLPSLSNRAPPLTLLPA